MNSAFALGCGCSSRPPLYQLLLIYRTGFVGWQDKSRAGVAIVDRDATVSSPTSYKSYDPKTQKGLETVRLADQNLKTWQVLRLL